MIEQCPNGAWVVSGDTHIGKWVREKGLIHDAHMSGIIRGLIREHGIKTCIDAGANIGTLTRVMLDEGCGVFAFEPNHDCVACLRKNCPEAVVYECALSGCNRKVSLISDVNVGASHVSETEGEIRVQSMTMDSYGHFAPGFIKLDCEGWEPKALRGGYETIRKYHPFIICEVNQGALLRARESRESLFAILDELGYPEANRTILQPQQTPESEIYDILCRP